MEKPKVRILVVDDEQGLCAGIQEALRREGYRVDASTEAIAAARLAQDTLYNLVISDIVMPQMGGKELVEQLLLMKPQIKMIFISGYTENSIVHQGVLDPNIDFLQKLFSYDTIAIKVREVLDRND